MLYSIFIWALCTLCLAYRICPGHDCKSLLVSAVPTVGENHISHQISHCIADAGAAGDAKLGNIKVEASQYCSAVSLIVEVFKLIVDQ